MIMHRPAASGRCAEYGETWRSRWSAGLAPLKSPCATAYCPQLLVTAITVPIHGSGTTGHDSLCRLGGTLTMFRDLSGEALHVCSDQQETISGNLVGESGAGLR
jgi:hypothetical protein